MPAAELTFYAGDTEYVNIQLPVAEENSSSEPPLILCVLDVHGSKCVLRPSPTMDGEALNHGSVSAASPRATPAVYTRA